MYYYGMQMMCKLNLEACCLFCCAIIQLPRLQFEILSFSGMHITVANMSSFAEGIMSTLFQVS